MKKATKNFLKTRMKVRQVFVCGKLTVSHRCIADEEHVFLITEELDFRTGTTDGDPTFVWNDLQGDVDESYEYVAPGTNAPTTAFFETCMYRAMYERKYKEEAPDSADFSEFTWKYVLAFLCVVHLLTCVHFQTERKEAKRKN